MLARQGWSIAPDVAAEGGAGYGVRGNHGSVFGDLTARAVQPDDTLVVFFGSRNDQRSTRRRWPSPPTTPSRWRGAPRRTPVCW